MTEDLSKSKKLSVLLSLIWRNPSYGLDRILAELSEVKGKKIYSRSGIQKALTKLGLNTAKKRRAWARRITTAEVAGKFAETYAKGIPRRLKPEERLEMIRLAEEREIPISRIAQANGISRKSFYKWKRRYEASAPGKEYQEVCDKKPFIERRWNQLTDEQVARILEIVVEHPEYSTHKVCRALPKIVGKSILGNHGVQNVFRRLNLNTYEKRLAYAQAQAPIITPVVGLPETIKRFIGKIPAISAIPPPTREKIAPLARPFVFSFLSSVVFSTILIFWLRTLAQAPTPGAKIGLFFATIALSVGSIFFAYSMKYYLTLALVLSFSRQPLEEGGGFAIGLNGRLNGGRGNGNGWLQRIFGLGNGPSTLRQAQGSGLNGGRNGIVQAGGLQPSLEHIKLKRYPFVSIHLPFYNEKKVAERIFKACTSMDYPNFEIVVCDDSTDETTKIVQRFAEQHNKEQTTNNKGPVIKVLHRKTRQGFKGGALGYALKHMNPKTEFVVVFDADFIPYPDTLELFIKYFKANNPSTGSGQGYSENYAKSNVACVAGYQWHVLNKSENWITRGVRTEYAGSYVVERSGQEILGAMKLIHGSVYAIRADILKKFGWGTSITEDFQLTLKLYEKGYKVIYTPYVQAPAECVSTLKRLIRQRMRWAEGHSNNIRRMFIRLMFGHWEEVEEDQNISISGKENREQRTEGLVTRLFRRLQLINRSSDSLPPINRSTGSLPQKQRKFIPSPLTLAEKLEVLYLSPYYLQAAFFLVGTFSWLLAETVFRARLPFWTSLWGWSLVLTNFFSLPLMNAVGLFLEESEEKDYLGILSFIFLSYLLVPFQAYASVKGFLEKEEGPWFRTPKTGLITDIFTRGKFYRWISGIIPGRRPAPAIASAAQGLGSRVQGLVEKGLYPSGYFEQSEKQGSLPIGGGSYTLNPYVALATANNRFESFRISRKSIRGISISLLAILLIISSTLVYLTPTIPPFIKPQETQAKAFGTIVGPHQIPPRGELGGQAGKEETRVTLEILNPYSHPKEGEEWVVNFKTTGKADLTITPQDQATIDDLDFVSLKCLSSEASAKEDGGEEREPKIFDGLASTDKDIIFYPDWECLETASLTHHVNKSGKHTLKFQFGDQIGYAYNATVQVDTSTFSSPTAYSFQRKTWYDGTRLWSAFYSGTEIEFWYSTDWGSSWTQNSSATITVSTNDFTIEADTADAFIAYTNGYDIIANEDTGTYPATNFAWGASPTIVYDGTGTTDEYDYPAMTKDSNNKVWITATHLSGTDYLFKARQATNANDISAWQTASTLDTSSNSNKYGTIVPLSSGKMYATWIDGTTIEGKEVYSSQTPTTVGTSTIQYATITIPQRKSFYANGRFWVWYSDGTNMGYRTSTNGTTWSDFASVRACPTNSRRFSVWFDGTYVHYAYSDEVAGNPMYYRRGTPNSDGSVTWSADEQTAVSGASQIQFPIIAVDSNGYPFIGYYYYEEKYVQSSRITKSSTNDGTWTTDTGFPYTLHEGPWDFAIPIPLTAGKVYAVYAIDSTAPKGKLWNGSSWGSEETAGSSTISYANFMSATSEGDNVHLVFHKSSTYDIIYVKRTYGTGWGSEETVQSSTTESSVPVLSINTGNSDLYCFWDDSPSTDHIYYKKRNGTGWDSSPTDWIDETTDDLTPGASLTSYYKDYGGKIGLVYMSKTASPYNIRFKFLVPTTTIATGVTGLTNNMSAVSDSSGNVHLLYIDSNDYAVYQEYTTSWQTAVTLDSNAGNDYATISLNTSNNDLYALWIRSNVIYYKKGVSPYASANWDASATSWKATGTNAWVTSNYSGAGMIFAQWTEGSASPYSVMWDYIIIPEKIWLLLGLGLVIPGLLRKTRRRQGSGGQGRNSGTKTNL